MTDGAVTATAPGKLVVAGEYAVLDGAPAIAASVGVRALARLVPAARGSLAIAGRGTAYPFERSGTELRWQGAGPGADGRILEAVSAACGDPDWPPLAITLDSRAFFDAAGKLGLGSSGAVTVALCGALAARLGIDGAELGALCHDAHRRFQSQRGSGIDVAASLAGGIVARNLPGAQQLELPAGLGILPVFTGHGASTRSLLDRYAGLRRERPREFAGCHTALSESARQAADAWLAGEPATIVAALRACGQALEQLDALLGGALYTPPHRALRALAADDDELAYKISGAGGGDFGIFAGTPARLESLRARIAGLGLVCLDAALGVDGLSVEIRGQ